MARSGQSTNADMASPNLQDLFSTSPNLECLFRAPRIEDLRTIAPATHHDGIGHHASTSTHQEIDGYSPVPTFQDSFVKFNHRQKDREDSPMLFPLNMIYNEQAPSQEGVGTPDKGLQLLSDPLDSQDTFAYSCPPTLRQPDVVLQPQPIFGQSFDKHLKLEQYDLVPEEKEEDHQYAQEVKTINSALVPNKEAPFFLHDHTSTVQSVGSKSAQSQEASHQPEYEFHPPESSGKNFHAPMLEASNHQFVQYPTGQNSQNDFEESQENHLRQYGPYTNTNSTQSHFQENLPMNLHTTPDHYGSSAPPPGHSSQNVFEESQENHLRQYGPYTNSTPSHFQENFPMDLHYTPEHSDFSGPSPGHCSQNVFEEPQEKHLRQNGPSTNSTTPHFQVNLPMDLHSTPDHNGSSAPPPGHSSQNVFEERRERHLRQYGYTITNSSSSHFRENLPMDLQLRQYGSSTNSTPAHFQEDLPMDLHSAPDHFGFSAPPPQNESFVQPPVLTRHPYDYAAATPRPHNFSSNPFGQNFLYGAPFGHFGFPYPPPTLSAFFSSFPFRPPISNPVNLVNQPGSPSHQDYYIPVQNEFFYPRLPFTPPNGLMNFPVPLPSQGHYFNPIPLHPGYDFALNLSLHHDGAVNVPGWVPNFNDHAQNAFPPPQGPR